MYSKHKTPKFPEIFEFQNPKKKIKTPPILSKFKLKKIRKEQSAIEASQKCVNLIGTCWALVLAFASHKRKYGAIFWVKNSNQICLELGVQILKEKICAMSSKSVILNFLWEI
jgi:hypothetical protein